MGAKLETRLHIVFMCTFHDDADALALIALPLIIKQMSAV